MPTTRWHILNGDSLLRAFPPKIEGEKIVVRECLVDGDVRFEDAESFYQRRARFICDMGGLSSPDAYGEMSAAEFEKIRAIPVGSSVWLWFEDDLFCQVHLWFVCRLLHDSVPNAQVRLVRPETHTMWGFGGLSGLELQRAYDGAPKVHDLAPFVALWQAYEQDNRQALLVKAREMESDYPFVLPAVNAHCDRIPSAGDPGRPTRVLRQIMDELQTREFGRVFREFSRREPIYGFGDLQVKRLFDALLENG